MKALKNQRAKRKPKSETDASFNRLLTEIHQRLIESSEYWRTRPTNPPSVNAPVYIALLEVAKVIEAAMKWDEEHPRRGA